MLSLDRYLSSRTIGIVERLECNSHPVSLSCGRLVIDMAAAAESVFNLAAASVMNEGAAALWGYGASPLLSFVIGRHPSRST